MVAVLAVDNGVGFVSFIVLIWGAVAAGEVFAVGEQIVGRCYLIYIPAAAYQDGFKGGALVEYVVHISNILCVEAAKVERSKAYAVAEHSAHISNLRCVEAAKVERFKGEAEVEHASHISNLRSV